MLKLETVREQLRIMRKRNAPIFLDIGEVRDSLFVVSKTEGIIDAWAPQIYGGNLNNGENGFLL